MTGAGVIYGYSGSCLDCPSEVSGALSSESVDREQLILAAIALCNGFATTYDQANACFGGCCLPPVGAVVMHVALRPVRWVIPGFHTAPARLTKVTDVVVRDSRALVDNVRSAVFTDVDTMSEITWPGACLPLAVVAHSTLTVIDAQSGKLLKQFAIPGGVDRVSGVTQVSDSELLLIATPSVPTSRTGHPSAKPAPRSVPSCLYRLSFMGDGWWVKGGPARVTGIKSIDGRRVLLYGVADESPTAIGTFDAEGVELSLSPTMHFLDTRSSIICAAIFGKGGLFTATFGTSDGKVAQVTISLCHRTGLCTLSHASQVAQAPAGARQFNIIPFRQSKTGKTFIVAPDYAGQAIYDGLMRKLLAVSEKGDAVSSTATWPDAPFVALLQQSRIFVVDLRSFAS